MGAERFLGCRVDRKSGEDEDDDFSLEGFHHELDDEQEDPISDDDCGGEAEERRIYWESQHLLLQVPPTLQKMSLLLVFQLKLEVVGRKWKCPRKSKDLINLPLI